MRKERCTAIVLAAGSGKRMQSAVAKQYLLLNGKPILWYALHTFEESSLIDEVILVVGAGEVSYVLREIVEKYGFRKVINVLEGGAERYLSVWEGLQAIGQSDIVFIHDGARPFVTEDIILRTYEQAKVHGACVAGMPVKDTIKVSDEEGFADHTPKRKLVWQIQTPQVFQADLIKEAYSKLIDNLESLKNAGAEITDDAMVVETMRGEKVKLVEASYQNIKITTPEDMAIAECFLRK